MITNRDVEAWKACPECGDIQDLRGLEVTRTVCHKCTPHIFLMDAQELLMHAEITFHRERKLRDIALNLTRQAAIWECIEKAIAEYSDAQREGLDCNAAWDCAKEGMNELLK